jgi:hypothetical protein
VEGRLRVEEKTTGRTPPRQSHRRESDGTPSRRLPAKPSRSAEQVSRTHLPIRIARRASAGMLRAAALRTIRLRRAHLRIYNPFVSGGPCEAAVRLPSAESTS